MGPRETLSLSFFQLIRGSGKFRPAASFKTKALSQFSSRLSSASTCSSFRVAGTQGTRDWSLSWYQRKDEQGSNKEKDERTSFFRFLTLSPILFFWFSGVAKCEDKQGPAAGLGSKNSCTDIAPASANKAKITKTAEKGLQTEQSVSECYVPAAAASSQSQSQAQLFKSAKEQGLSPPASLAPPVKNYPSSNAAALPVCNGKAPLKWCEEVDLSHKTLVRQSCQLGVDSVTRILCETVAAYQDIHDKYRNLLDRLIDSLEFSRTAEGVQQELLDCKLIMMRAEMEEMKGRIMELECFLGSIQRLSDSMAETAFLGNAEYHSVAMSERLDSALREIKCVKEETARKERDMIEIQTVVIVESGKGLK